MSYIGIGSPIPDISSLPGQTGGEVEVTLDYPSAAVCNDGGVLTPTFDPAGGVFAATPSGLNINTSTGVVTPTGSTPQDYTISYTVSGVVSSFDLTINAVQQSTFSYASNSFEDSGTALPTLAAGTTSGGAFVSSSPSDLTVNASTGELTLAGATVGGPYTITYTTPGPCATSSTFQISITATVRIIANNFALDFNGTDEYIGVNYNSIFDQAQYSFSLWIKNTQNNINSDKGILCADANGNRGFALQQNGQNLKWDSNISGSSSQLLDANFFDTISTWVHCAVAYDGSSLKMYKNGQLQETVSSSTSNMNANNNNITIGNNPFTTGRFFSGAIDEVAIWNKAISANAVQEIYNATTNNPGFTADLFKLANESQAPVYWNRMGDD